MLRLATSDIRTSIPFITAASPPEGRCLSPRKCDSVMILSPPFAASQHVVSWNHSESLDGELLMASSALVSPTSLRRIASGRYMPPLWRKTMMGIFGSLAPPAGAWAAADCPTGLFSTRLVIAFVESGRYTLWFVRSKASGAGLSRRETDRSFHPGFLSTRIVRKPGGFSPSVDSYFPGFTLWISVPPVAVDPKVSCAL